MESDKTADSKKATCQIKVVPFPLKGIYQVAKFIIANFCCG